MILNSHNKIDIYMYKNKAWGKIMYGNIGSAAVFKDRKGYFTADWDEKLQKEYKKYLPKSWKPAPDVQKECFNEEKRKWQVCKPAKTSYEKFQRHKKILLNGKNRVLYIKSSSKKTDPVLYIKHKGIMLTYKQFLKHNGGGGGLSKTKSANSANSSANDTKDIYIISDLRETVRIDGEEYIKDKDPSTSSGGEKNVPLQDMILFDNIPKKHAILINGRIYDVRGLGVWVTQSKTTTVYDPFRKIISEEAKQHINVLYHLTDGDEPDLIDMYLINMTEKKGSDLRSFVKSTKKYYILDVAYKIRIVFTKGIDVEYTSNTPVYQALRTKANSSRTLKDILIQNLKSIPSKDILAIYLIPSIASN